MGIDSGAFIGAVGSVCTNLPGVAASKKRDNGAAQRHAAHSRSATSSGGGPKPKSFATGLSSR